MRHRSPCLTLSFIAIGCWLAAAPAVSQENPPPGQAPYLDQLKVDREETWIQGEWRKLTSFRHLDRAFELMQSGSLAEAKTEFDRYLARDPADLRARADYLNLLYRLKDYEGCVKQAALILAKRPSYVPAYLYRGLASQHLGKLEAAIEDYKKAAALNEAAPADRLFALNSAADLAMQIRKYEEAIRLMESVPPSGRDATFHVREGMACEQLGDDTAAAAAYRKALESNQTPEFKARLHRTIAELAIRQGRWSEAEQELRAALELTPGNTELSRAHAMAAYEAASRSGRWTDALAAAENLAENSTDPAAQMRVGLAFEKLGRYQDAAAAYAGAAGLSDADPQKLRAWRAAAVAAQKARDWRLVEKALLEAQRLEPRNRDILRGLADALAEQKDPAGAAGWMEKALAVKPDLNDEESLANLYLQLEDYGRAIELLQRVLRGVRAEANRHRIYMALGYAYASSGRKDEAAAAFSEAAALRRDPATLVALAESLESDGRLLQAGEYRRQLIDLAPTANNYYSLGMLYARLDRKEEAARQLEEAVDRGLAEQKRAIALKQAGMLYQSLARYEPARQALVAARSLNPQDASLPLAIAEIDLQTGRYSAALESVGQSLEIKETERGLQVRALVQEKIGDSRKAIADYERLSDIRSGDPAARSSALLSLANLEFGLGLYPSAAGHYIEILGPNQSGEPDTLGQAAESLALAGNLEKAVDVNRRIVDLPDASAAQKFAAFRRLGFLYLQLKRSDLSEQCFRSAIELGDKDSKTYQGLGLLLSDSGRFAEARDCFSSALEREKSPQSVLYLARSYVALGKPGVAIYYLEGILRKPDGLSEPERNDIYRELGYLYASEHEYARAAEAWRQSPGLGQAPDVALSMARMQRLLQNYEEARRILTDIDGHALSPALKGERLEELALVAFGQKSDQEAIRFMKQALEVQSTPSRLFMLGLAYQRGRSCEEAVRVLQQAVAQEPLNDTYALALAYALQKAGKREEAIRTLEMVAVRNPDYLNVVRDLGYLYRKGSDNAEAVTWFRRAIDEAPLYPQRTEKEILAVQRDVYRMRNEIRSINNRYDLTGYLTYRSNAAVGAASVMGGGVLQSQGGVEFGYQPPKIGFRSGRVFQVTSRLLWNVQPGSLRFTADSLQAGLGVRYKPLETQNLYLGGERIFGIGDATSSGWLWRGMYSWSRGQDLMPGRRVRNYSLVYGDGGYFTPNGGMMALYSEIQQGAAVRFMSHALLKPHVVVDGRYQNHNMPQGTYVEAGGGLSLQLFLSGARYETERVGFEFIFHYKRSWLQPGFDLQEDRVQNGWTVTSLVLF
jgi:bacteriophage N4 adsorption protein A